MSTDAAVRNGSLLRVEDLKTYFPVKKGLFRRTVGHIRAVDGVSFSVWRGQTVGLVGESGCGKTTVARTIVRLVPATSGKVFFEGKDVLSATRKEMRLLRKEISLVFQDPFGSLNPRMTVGNIVGEPIRVHKKLSGKQLRERVAELLCRVGLSADHINRYPHEFSGGQRQRIGIARALALQPKLVICDEPVSALDVSIQSQILNLLKELQEQFNLTYLLIAHDLAVVQFACDAVCVMYLGRIVESASAEELYRNPLHPYTRALMAAIPEVDPARRGRRMSSGGEVPSLLRAPGGCAFHPRCPLAEQLCRERIPLLEEKQAAGRCDADPPHLVACWKC